MRKVNNISMPLVKIQFSAWVELDGRVGATFSSADQPRLTLNTDIILYHSLICSTPLVHQTGIETTLA